MSAFLLPALILALLALLPVMIGLKRPAAPISARESALRLYRGQLGDLERDHALGLVSDEEEDAARLEIQRRLLGADNAFPAEERHGKRSARRKTALSLGLGIPLLALGLYLVNGHPFLPPAPLSARELKPDDRTLAMVRMLRDRVASLTRDDPAYAQGHVLLGQVEARAGMTDQAITDWKAALEVRFTPELALEIAELQYQRDGRISADSLDLYRRALAAAPKDAPWRLQVEARIAVGEHDEGKTP